MNKMSKPRGGWTTREAPKWIRPRKYPWLFDIRDGAYGQCEACSRVATKLVYYLERENQEFLSTLVLCAGHVGLVRNNWSDLFKAIDLKIDRGMK